MKTGVIFDLDGTLLDTLEDLADAVNHTMEVYGYPRHSLSYVRSIVGNGVRNLVMLALPEDQAHRADEILPFYREYYNAHSQDKTRPYPGIVEALKALSRDYAVAVVSNKPDGMVKTLCREFFGDIYALGEDPALPKKPAPDMVFKAMADMGVERCIYVGDSDVDIKTARNAGVPCLSVLWGFRDRDVLEQVGGENFCEDPRNLCEAIAEITAKYEK